MRTTIDINDALLREIRECASRSGRSFKQMLEETLKLGLLQQNKPQKRRRVRIRPHRLGLKPGFHGTSLNQLYDQFEAEDTAGES